MNIEQRSEDVFVRDDGLVNMVYSVEEGRKIPYRVYGVLGILKDNVVWRLIKSEPASPNDKWLESEDGKQFKKDIEDSGLFDRDNPGGYPDDDENADGGVFDPN